LHFLNFALDNYTKELVIGAAAVLAAGFGIKTFIDKQKEKQEEGKGDIPLVPSLKKRYSSVYAPKHIKPHEESLQQECREIF